MNRSLLLLPAFVLCHATAFSQDVDLHGTVTSAVGGGPLARVLVGLVGRPQLTATTDDNGYYAISTATAVAPHSVPSGRLSGSRIEGSCLLFNVQEPAPVTVEIFSARGAKVADILNGVAMAPGAYRLELSALGLAPGAYLVRYAQRQERSAHRFVLMPGARVSSAGALQGSGTAAQAKRLADEVDTLIFSLAGYVTLRLPIPSYTGQYDVALTPIQCAPGGVSASDGASLDTVLVSWRSCPGAQGYAIWRQRLGDTAIAVLDTVADTVFADTTVGPGPFRYCVVALYGSGQTGEPSAWDGGYRKVTNREFLIEYNNTTIYTSHQKLALMQRQELGRDSAYGDSSGIVRYNASFSMATLRATVILAYTDYRDDYLTVNGAYTTVVTLAGNGDVTGPMTVAGIYSGTVEYFITVTNRQPSGGYYRVTQTGGAPEDITFDSVRNDLLR